jgi:GT2 family glycosyltransferase
LRSFDVEEDTVREALEHTAATVFAREYESLRRIEGMCSARLAHDCAFFFDFSSRDDTGAGTLNAFRTDPEAPPGELALEDNDDISATSADLEAWLGRIEGHDHIRTDRAHVMIAAALMGRTVEYAPSAYFKVQALAESWLSNFPVTRIEAPRRRVGSADPGEPLRARLTDLARAQPSPPPGSSACGSGTAAITAVILTRDRVGHVSRAIASVLSSSVPARVLVIGNNPARPSRAALTALAASDPRVELRLLDRNLGCAGGRRLGSELAQTEFVLFLDDDAELIEGAVERMVADLRSHPEAVGVTAMVVGSDGLVQHCGGSVELGGGSARFSLGGADLALDDPRVPATGPSEWLPHGVALIRADALRAIPIDPRMSRYYEDNDWSLRVERERPGRLRRCREAIALHHGGGSAPPAGCRLEHVFDLVEFLGAQAEFLHRNGVLIDVDLFARIPELQSPDVGDGSIDLVAVRLLLELVAARGVAWVAAEWLGDGLEPLLGAGRRVAALQATIAAREAQVAERDAQIAELMSAHHEVGVYATGLRNENEDLRNEKEELRGRREWLIARHEKLTRIEQGGWWRLRSRLLPLLRAADACRRLWRSLARR